MTARVIPFPRRPRVDRVAAGFAIAIGARPGEVVLIARGVQLGFTPEQARELSRDLAELANAAEGKP